MSKLSYGDKINLYNDKKFGISIWSVDIDEGLPISGMLVNWIKNIKNMNII